MVGSAFGAFLAVVAARKLHMGVLRRNFLDPNPAQNGQVRFLPRKSGLEFRPRRLVRPASRNAAAFPAAGTTPARLAGGKGTARTALGIDLPARLAYLQKAMKIYAGLLAAAIFAPGAWAADVSAEGIPEESLRMFENLRQVIVQVSSRVKPWVVHIEAVRKQGDQKYKILGSGLILNSRGYVVTNHHIADEAKLITVILPDSSKLEAELVGTDRQTDLALIKIPSKVRLPEPKLGDSSAVNVGEWIIAVGNPYGFDRTVYFGIVSGKGRTLSSLNPYEEVESGLEYTTDFIQTDASIDPGSSGGPLVNLRGEVIGINSLGLGRGMSFTIPINTVKEVTEKLMTSGRLSRGWIGLSVQPLTKELAGYFDLAGAGGILVCDVQDPSPAKSAGLQQGDIIVEYDGKKVSAENEEELNRFSRLIWGGEVGSRSLARIRRGGKLLTFSIDVKEQPNPTAREFETTWGFNVKEITQKIYRDNLLESQDGVIVSFVEAGTPGGEARLREGDVVIGIEGRACKDLNDFESKYRALEADGTRNVLLLVKRGKDFVYLLLELAKYKVKP